MKKSRNLLLAIMVACMALFCDMPVAVRAEESNKGIELISFDHLPNKKVQVGTQQFVIGLPFMITAQCLENGISKDVQVSVKAWNATSTYDPDKKGEYTFNPVLEDGFSLASGVALPTQKVEVTEVELTSFASLQDITVQVGTEQSMLSLPNLLVATYSENGTPMNINVLVKEWTCTPTYDPNVEGTYTFTPVLELNYDMMAGVSLPTQKVTVKQIKLTSFATLSDKSVAVGTSKENIDLNSSLSATYQENGNDVNISVPVKEWTCTSTYDPNVEGTYTFTPVLALNYGVEAGVTLPTQKVTVKVLELTSLQNLSDKKVAVGTSQENIGLYPLLSATYQENGNDVNISVPVKEWTCTPTYDPNVEGEYIFTPVISSGYKMAIGVILPTQKVTVTIIELTSFEDANLNDKKFPLGVNQNRLGLPNEVSAKYQDGTKEIMIQVPVKEWTCTPTYDPKVEGEYLFTPKFGLGYSIAAGVTLPTQKVILDSSLSFGYNPVDVEVINNIITNNGLKGYKLNDPDNWDFITWMGNLTSQTIFTIDLTQKGLTGELNVSRLSTLDTLKVGMNALTSLGTLPNSLLSLTCNDNQLTNLLPLPTNIQFLSCYKNKISGEMDLSGYKKLTNLDCGNNQITSLGPKLPDNLVSLYCNNNLITDLGPLPIFMTDLRCQSNKLTGKLDVSALKGLVALDCHENELTSLGTLPNLINYFDCSKNKINELGTLPSSLVTFICNNNQLSTLGKLPIGITELRCEYNNLTGILDISELHQLTLLVCNANQITGLGHLPSSLDFLDCSNNQIESFENLPSSLTRFFFGRNKISGVFDFTTLPGLIDFGCENNQITELKGPLPSGLIALQCSENLLTSIPKIPTGVISLSCTGNKLTKLPELPAGLQELYCAYNQLTSLPDTLPKGLIYIRCGSNQITHIPELPHTLTELSSSNNPLTSPLPSLPAGLTVLDCANNNVSGPMDLSGFRNLETVICYQNQITSLNLNGLAKMNLLYFADNPLQSFVAPDGNECTMVSDKGGNIMSGRAMTGKGEIDQYNPGYNLKTKELTLRSQPEPWYARGLWSTNSNVSYLNGANDRSEVISFTLDQDITVHATYSGGRPLTGDNSNTSLYVGLLMVGLLGMISTTYIIQRKRRTARNVK